MWIDHEITSSVFSRRIFSLLRKKSISDENKGHQANVDKNVLLRDTQKSSLDYVLTTVDSVVNWARQGSIWPMTFGKALKRKEECM